MRKNRRSCKRMRVSRGNMPSLKVLAAYGLKNGYEPNIYPMRGNWMWGAQAQIPLFDGGRVKSSGRRSASGNRNRNRRIRRMLSGKFGQMLNRPWLMFRHRGRKCKFRMFSSSRHLKRFAIARTRYETGSVTNLDLLDAETAESSSEVDEFAGTLSLCHQQV